MSPAKIFRQVVKCGLVPAMVLAMTSMPTSFAQAANCLTADEAAAERVRRLQTTLMIGALQCRNRDDVKVTDIYNKVVRQYGSVISAHNQILTRYFQRTHGSGYQRAMDRHVTAMANVIARAANKDPGFCSATAEAGLALLAPDAADIVDQAQWTELVAMQGVDACEPVRSRRADNTPAP